MSLATLPQELIFETAFYLPKRSIINLGLWTFNKQICAACEPLLKCLAAAKAFERRMHGRFPYMDDEDQWPQLKEKDYVKLGFDKKFGPYAPNEHPNGDFLEPLAGTLEWLPPYRGEPTYRQARKYSTKAVALRLKGKAKRLGLEVPAAFLQLLSDETLQRRMDLDGGGWYYELGDCLRKCPKSMQNGENDAYVIRFYSDQQGCAYTSLYLDSGPEKGHCVVYGAFDANCQATDEDFAADPELLDTTFAADIATEVRTMLDGGEKVAWNTWGDIAVVSCDFEEWMAKLHFRMAFDRATLPWDEPENELGGVEEEYVRWNFSSGSKVG